MENMHIRLKYTFILLGNKKKGSPVGRVKEGMKKRGGGPGGGDRSANLTYLTKDELLKRQHDMAKELRNLGSHRNPTNAEKTTEAAKTEEKKTNKRKTPETESEECSFEAISAVIPGGLPNLSGYY